MFYFFYSASKKRRICTCNIRVKIDWKKGTINYSREQTHSITSAINNTTVTKHKGMATSKDSLWSIPKGEIKGSLTT